MKHTNITIQGKDLVSSYGVYIILIQDNDITYYYVGQTGDALNITARGPFYRFAAHLGYGTSTQNQVYEGLKRENGLDNREQMEKWLSDKKLDIHYFQTADFMFLEKSDENKQTHNGLRKVTLEIETALLHLLKDRPNLIRLNKNPVTIKSYDNQKANAEYILDTIKL